MSDTLVEAIEVQQASIDQLCQHVALLTQSVAILLGEEMGKPADEEGEDPHRTMDGEGLSFRGARG